MDPHCGYSWWIPIIDLHGRIHLVYSHGWIHMIWWIPIDGSHGWILIDVSHWMDPHEWIPMNGWIHIDGLSLIDTQRWIPMEGIPMERFHVDISPWGSTVDRRTH